MGKGAALSWPHLGPPGTGTEPRRRCGSCSHTHGAVAQDLGGHKGRFAWGSSRPGRRSNPCGGLASAGPLISSLQGRWGKAQRPLWMGEITALGEQQRQGVPAPALCQSPPLLVGLPHNPALGRGGNWGGCPPRAGGCGGHPGWAIFQCCRCLRVRREWRREEDKARAAPWVSPHPSPLAAGDTGPSGNEVAPVREVSLLLLG